MPADPYTRLNNADSAFRHCVMFHIVLTPVRRLACESVINTWAVMGMCHS